MFTSTPNYTSIFYIIAIIWFILVVILINLIIKNKLTYVDEFRQKFVSGIFFLIITLTIMLIAQIALQIPQEIMSILIGSIIFTLIGFETLTLIGISQLIDYISSIIDFEIKNKKRNAILSSILITIILTIIYAINNLHNVAQINYVFVVPIGIFCFYFATIYTFLLHQEMKKINLNILLYIALVFLTITTVSTSIPFVNFISDPFFYVIVFFCFIGFDIILIIGYLDFKNKINKGLAK